MKLFFYSLFTIIMSISTNSSYALDNISMGKLCVIPNDSELNCTLREPQKINSECKCMHKSDDATGYTSSPDLFNKPSEGNSTEMLVNCHVTETEAVCNGLLYKKSKSFTSSFLNFIKSGNNIEYKIKGKGTLCQGIEGSVTSRNSRGAAGACNLASPDSIGNSCVCHYKDIDDEKGKVAYGDNDIKRKDIDTKCKTTEKLAVCDHIDYIRAEDSINNSSNSFSKKIDDFILHIRKPGLGQGK